MFFQTDSLSQKQLVGPSIKLPIICSLYLRPSFISSAIFNVTNSFPKMLDLIVFCHWKYHIIGAPFKKDTIPVVECLVFKQAECAASQTYLPVPDFALDFGMLVRNVSPPISG